MGILRITIQETWIWVILKECSEEEKDLGANKNKEPMRLFKVAWREWIESDVSQKIVDKQSGGTSGEESTC